MQGQRSFPSSYQRSQEVIMKGRLAVIALGAIALMASEASAQTNSQHRATSQTHVRHIPRVFAHTYGYAPRAVPQNEALRDRYRTYTNPSRLVVSRSRIRIAQFLLLMSDGWRRGLSDE